MMDDVDNCEEYIRYNEKYNKYDPEGEWTKFCEFFVYAGARTAPARGFDRMLPD